jgi:hypothetical protein
MTTQDCSQRQSDRTVSAKEWRFLVSCSNSHLRHWQNTCSDGLQWVWSCQVQGFEEIGLVAEAKQAVLTRCGSSRTPSTSPLQFFVTSLQTSTTDFPCHSAHKNNLILSSNPTSNCPRDSAKIANLQLLDSVFHLGV